MVTKDDIFFALGRPEGIGSGFRTDDGANVDRGVDVQGSSMGVAGYSGDYTGTVSLLGLNRIGVWGLGDRWGVYGMTNNVGPDSGAVGTFRLAGVIGTSDTEFGVVGTSSVSSGVYGQAGDVATTFNVAGVLGTSRQAVGVYGASSENVAVWGEAQSDVGVFGRSHQYQGVRGVLANNGPLFGNGKAGVAGTSVASPGVVGTSEQSWGIVGQSGAAGPSSQSAGVFGTAAASFGIAGTSQAYPGVFGTSTNSFGMIAISSSPGPLFGLPFPLPAAVFATSANNPGVIGTSGASYGVAGLSAALPSPTTPPTQVPAGVRGESTNGGFGVLGVTTSAAASPGAGVTGICIGNGYAGQFIGNLFVSGQIFAGIKDAIVPFPDGSQRVLHCMESPEHWFEDFGSARLKRGRATVKLDADFAKVVMLGDYRVFLTPEGDCKGLYVQSKRGASFEVRELQGGDSSIAFSYRIVAKRKDIKRHTRFAKIETPVIPMPIGKARAARGRKPAELPPSVRALFSTLERETKRAT